MVVYVDPLGIVDRASGFGFRAYRACGLVKLLNLMPEPFTLTPKP